MSVQPSIGIVAQREAAQDPGATVRVHRTVSGDTLTRILSILKGLGLSVSILCDAANALATFAFSPSLPEDGILTHDLTM